MLLPLALYREESESEEELEWRLLRAGDLDRGLRGDKNIKKHFAIMQNFKSSAITSQRINKSGKTKQ